MRTDCLNQKCHLLLEEGHIWDIWIQHQSQTMAKTRNRPEIPEENQMVNLSSNPDRHVADMAFMSITRQKGVNSKSIDN